MRLTLSLLSLAFATAPAYAQHQFTLRVDYDQSAPNTDAAFVTKAWTDSVSVYLNNELAQRGPNNLVIVPDSRDADFRLLIQSLPVMAGAQTTGLTTYSLIAFRSPNIGNNWQYLTSAVGYTRSPRAAASEILRFVSEALGAR